MNSLDDFNPASVLRFGPYTFHVRQRLVLNGDQPVRVGSRALDILQVLVERAGRVVTKAQLIAQVWPTSVVEEINLRVHIAALRRALGDGGNGQRYIVNLPQCGYSFIAPVHRDSAAPQTPANAPPPHNLPARLTPVIGRDALVGSLMRHLPACRLLTITGPTGVGKSTVALRVAELLVQYFRHGVWHVDLAQISDDSALLEHCLDRLGSDLAGLCERHALLVLDNAEHQHAACKALVETLSGVAPRVSFLVTSREPLQVSGEVLKQLPPLNLPKPVAVDDVAEAMGCAAVQLFVSRARARQHDFQLRTQDVQPLREICRQLDGLPLAIELAAAQIDALGLVGLHMHVANGLQVLSQGRRTAVPRHQSMQAALDCSYQRLSEPEQRVLQRLSVFKMPFTLEAALAVVSCTQLASSRLAAIITSLVHKSLLTEEGSGSACRYRMLNTTRRYAREQLERSGEGVELERRYARYINQLRRVSGVHALT
ncbi:helix-turn-helix transcriptional regulator [Pseudomonas sp. R4-83]|uniref:ATP-binding protein n=1 Tax=unclassified Pseudomonas TaxID=196821 RepID=UPI003DA8C24D